MSPPLRRQADVDGCIAGLADGTIDVICTDHAPARSRKENARAGPGPLRHRGPGNGAGPGRDAAWSSPAISTWPQVLEKLTINPARILGIDKGTLSIGADADVTIIDPARRWDVDPTQLRLKKPQLPLRRLDPHRPRRNRDRRRQGEVSGRGKLGIAQSTFLGAGHLARVACVPGFFLDAACAATITAWV